MIFAITNLLLVSSVAVALPRPGALSFLGLNRSHIQRNKQAAGNPKGSGYGKYKCPCVGIDNLRGYFAATLDYHHVQYPLETGASCQNWELNIHPECTKEPMPQWCRESWCYVDPCNCDLDVPPKRTALGTTFQGNLAYFSYDTCSGFDFWTQEKNPQACGLQKDSASCTQAPDCAWNGKQCLGKDVAETCSGIAPHPQLHTPPALHHSLSPHGHQDCRCVGLGGHSNGLAVRYISDTQEARYNSNVGSSCAAWEIDAHPQCTGAGVMPGWCSQKWCYVDPCKCDIAIPPKAVTMANAYERYQGKTAYFSYETCGSDQSYVQDKKSEYCYSYTTAETCKTVKKCRWTGEKCMGQALAETCAVQKETGILGMDTPFERAGAHKLEYSSFVLMVLVVLAVGGR